MVGNRDSASRWVVAIGLSTLAVHAWWFKGGPDFHAFYQAGLRLRHHQPIYQLSDGIPFKYLPVVAQWVTPWTLLPEGTARVLWVFLSAAAIALFFCWCSREASQEHKWQSSLAVLALVTPFLVQELSLGQCDGMLLFLMAESERQRTRRPWASGILWAIACLVKPPYLIFALIVVAWREWRRLQFLGAGLLMGIAAGMVPFEAALPQLQAWQGLLRTTSPTVLCAPDNQSLFAILCTYGVAADSALLPVAATGFALGLIILVALAVQRLRQHAEREARFLAASAAFYLTAFLSPLGWQTNLVATIPLQFFLLRRWDLSSDSRVRGLIAFAIALVAAADLLNHETVGRAVFQKLLHFRHYGIAALLMALVACATAWLSSLSARRPEPACAGR